MPYLKIIKRTSEDNYKEVVLFDGEITKEQNEKINNFFDKISSINRKLIERLDERLKLKVKDIKNSKKN